MSAIASEWRAGSSESNQASVACAHGGMDDGFEVAPRRGIGEDDRRERWRSSVPDCVSTTAAETGRITAARPGVPGATASRASVSASIVGTPERLELGAHVALARRDAAGQGHAAHDHAPATCARSRPRRCSSAASRW